MKVLYINGASDSGGVTTQQLAKIAPTLQISSVATVAEAVTEIRKGGWHGLLTPPTSAEHDTLTLIARLRQDRVPIAIVPIVTEWRQEFFSAAVAAGADDVLLVRGETAVHAGETLSRIKHSPHLRPAEERRLRVLYVGKDPLVGSLLDQVPFVKTERATSVADGAIAGRTPAPGPDPLHADAVVIDDAPGESPSIAVLKFVRGHAPDLPIIVLTPPNAGETAAGVLDLGVDDCILKSGIYRRRLIASLNRIYQRHDLVVQHTTIKARETRLRQIVENLPEALAIVSGDGTILAVNGAGLPLFGVARPGDVVGRDFYGFMPAERRDDVRALVGKVGSGQRASLTVDLHAVDGVVRTLEIDGVMLERDARGARGVIAVLRPPRQTNTDDAQIARANLAAVTEEAKARVTALTTEFDKAKASHLAERSAWDAARAQLEERLQELITDADVRHGLDMRLATAETELQEVSAARKQFEAELEAARVVVREITASRDELAGRLDAARDELRHAVESHLSERTGWDTLRRTLETQIEESHNYGDARSELERQLSAARSELSAVQADLDGTRSELNGARDQVTAALHQVDALRNERQRERTDLERAIAELTAERDGLRTAGDGLRAQLDSRISDAQTSAVAHLEAEARLEAARTDMRQAVDTFAAERAGWEATRRQLEARLHETQAAAGARGDLEAELDAARSELRALAEASSRDRAAWDGTRRTLHEQLEDARRAHSTDRDAWQTDRAAWKNDREALERRLADSGNAETERTRLEESLRTLQAQHAAYLEAQAIDRATRERERAELDALRAAVDEERARRIKLDDELAAVRAEASGRVTALEVEYTATRRVLEVQIDDAEARTRRLAGESHVAHHELASHLATMAASRDRLADSRLFGYALTTLEGRLLRCNDTFAQLFGYADRQEALARSNGGAFPPIAGREGLDARLLAERSIPQVESCLERADGTPITVLESAAIVATPADLTEASGEREIIERLIVDMSGSSALEGRLRQARRLEEVGTLATAMAPDIVALIRAIEETGAQISADLSVKDAQQARLDKIRTRATRAADLVRQLVAFSRRQVQASPPVDLNEAVGRAGQMLTRLVGPHIDFEIRLGKADGVAASEDDLEQLLTTLVVSGRDLLPVGGSLVLETARLDFEQSGSSDGPVGPGVLLSVSASGYGVQPVQQAIAVEVVARRCGGEVRMNGEPGRRAALQVYFTRCGPAQPTRASVKKSLDRSGVSAEHWSAIPD
jgi:PAS domain S-box-containing protein